MFERGFGWPEQLEVLTGRTFPVDVYESKVSRNTLLRHLYQGPNQKTL
jgi:hypothetical protein